VKELKESISGAQLDAGDLDQQAQHLKRQLATLSDRIKRLESQVGLLKVQVCIRLQRRREAGGSELRVQMLLQEAAGNTLPGRIKGLDSQMRTGWGSFICATFAMYRAPQAGSKMPRCAISVFCLLVLCCVVLYCIAMYVLIPFLRLVKCCHAVCCCCCWQAAVKKEALESGIEEALRDKEAAMAENAAHQAKCLQHEAEVRGALCVLLLLPGWADRGEAGSDDSPATPHGHKSVCPAARGCVRVARSACRLLQKKHIDAHTTAETTSDTTTDISTHTNTDY
jgi:hypothetical protein